MRDRATLTVLVASVIACGGFTGLTTNPNGCLKDVPECERTTRGIDGFAANPAFCPPWICALPNPDATPLTAQIRVGQAVNLRINYSADLTGCGERPWTSVTWQSSTPDVVTIVGDSGFSSRSPGSSAVLTGRSAGITQVSAVLHFDSVCYPARDERVPLVVSADPDCLARAACRTIDQVSVVPD